MAGIFNLNKHKLPAGKYLLDTNVLMYTFEPSQNKNDPGYNNLIYSNLNNDNYQFMINSHIISEFINRFVRNRYNTYLKVENIKSPEKSYFKKVYRNSNDFKTSYNTAITIVKEDFFENFDLADELTELSITSSIPPVTFDYNDQLIINSAKQNDLNIITNDHDFLKTRTMNDCPDIFTFQTYFQN